MLGRYAEPAKRRNAELRDQRGGRFAGGVGRFVIGQVGGRDRPFDPLAGLFSDVVLSVWIGDRSVASGSD